MNSKSDKVGTSIDSVSERHLLQIVFGPYIVGKEGNISSTSAADPFFSQHTESHAVESGGSCSCQKVKRRHNILCKQVAFG
ncbi:hypothetical protein Gasu2_13680 [Galdieria sulphuraria]|uniref:Uncharacterized protein n=1 Tax=Galdieria sulphuraria TaxID=130081 RepID=M2XZG6_GALSU|nr:uncharacterized protein Gasu_36110 [Galdieria sulphuraria]EME29043.1 hypothetical protein Gasu_36110 [Galdieria sulphuraria]GJD06984.1 hypothetical protein Gasu2_13680 [Galdieria sulphuraria]|eukprot:XP_005705563.1 hypothetical protein Gasu_36110 [Galdieria sulphuraria]